MEPCRLLLKDMNWYLQGLCRLRQDYRTFKLMRMRDVCLIDETFALHDFPLEQLNTFSFEHEVKETLVLRIDNEIWEEMAGYYGEENIKPDGENHYLVTARLPVEEVTARMLIGYCNHCVCLEPKSMRELIVTLLENTISQYRQ